MTSTAQTRGVRKGLRDGFQAVLAVVAGGGATVAIEALAGTLHPGYSIALILAFKILIAYAQNYLETAGKIGVMLPTPGLVVAPGAVPTDKVVATVEAVADQAGEITGDVLDTVGDVVGTITGQTDEEEQTP